MVARGFTQGAFVILWILIYQLSGCFKGALLLMFSRCTFPIMVAQLCANNHSSSCLPSQGLYNESGGSSIAGTAWLGALAGRAFHTAALAQRMGWLDVRHGFGQAQQRVWDLPRRNNQGSAWPSFLYGRSSSALPMYFLTLETGINAKEH